VLFRCINASSSSSSGSTFYVHDRGQLKCDGALAETRFRLSAKRTSLFKSAWGRQFSLLAAEVCASAVVMLDTPCSEVVWTVLATHCIRQFPRHFLSRASPCAITFQPESTNGRYCNWRITLVQQTTPVWYTEAWKHVGVLDITNY